MNNTIIANYFSHHPDTDVFYFTADGQAFYTENEANNHARNLGQLGKDSRVEEISRENIADYEATKEEEEQPEDSAKGSSKKPGNRKK